jgi:hypothetical protein
LTEGKLPVWMNELRIGEGGKAELAAGVFVGMEESILTLNLKP